MQHCFCQVRLIHLIGQKSPHFEKKTQFVTFVGESVQVVALSGPVCGEVSSVVQYSTGIPVRGRELRVPLCVIEYYTHREISVLYLQGKRYCKNNC